MTDTEQGDVEKVARIIDPPSWAVADSYLAEVRRKDAAYDPEVFKDKNSMAKAREIIAALKASPPEGWVMVPVEPTEGMAFAGGEQLVQQYCDNRQWDAAKVAIEGIDATEVYRAMLSASPVKASPDHIPDVGKMVSPPPALEAGARAWAIRNGKLTPTETDDLIAALSPARLQGDQLAKLREAMEALEELLSAEIKARFGTDSSKTEAEVAGKSRVYPLLNVPRNIARNALKALSATGEE